MTETIKARYTSVVIPYNSNQQKNLIAKACVHIVQNQIENTVYKNETKEIDTKKQKRKNKNTTHKHDK